MPRLFVAIRPPAPVRDRLIAMAGGVDGARWQDAEQLHLTLRFLGEVDRRTGEDVVSALSDVRSAPFEVMIDGVGIFDRNGRVDTLWAGVAPHAPLAALHKKIDHALVRVGLPPEARAYRPHITLARGRMRDATAFLSAHAGISSAPFGVTHFTLFESMLGSGGARYDVVARWPLG